MMQQKGIKMCINDAAFAHAHSAAQILMLVYCAHNNKSKKKNTSHFKSYVVEYCKVVF